MPFRYFRLGMAFALACASTAPQAQTPPAGNPLDQLPVPVPLPSAVDRAPRVDVQMPAGAAAGKLDRTLTPTRFDIEGVNAVSFSEVADLFSPFAGRSVTISELVAAARKATTRYRDQGHPLSFVYLPEQEFEGGVVRVVAVEGYIASVRIEGDAGPAESKLREIADRLRAERPLTLASFERVAQLLTRLPGLTVTAEASMPGTTDGATVLVLKAKRVPYNVSLGADLRQPRSRAVLNGAWHDPLAAGSELSASTLIGDFSREKLFTLGYTQLVGADGLTTKTSFSSYRGYPDEQSGRGAHIERFNTNRRLELSAGYPLSLTARSSLTLSGGFYAVDNTDRYRVPATGALLDEDTRMRAMFAQLAYADAQSDRSRFASLMVAQGLDGAGARAETRSNVAGLSGPGEAKLNFTRIALEASQRDRFANQWGSAISFGAQYSADSLAASERISFGGPRFGRGYSAGDAAGDSGWGLGLELNRMFKFDGNWVRQVEPYLLFEMARVSTRLHTPSPEMLRSIALGARVSDARHYSVDVAIAKPMGDATASNPAKRARVSLLLTYQLFER